MDCWHSSFYLAHAYNAYGKCNVFTIFCLSSVHSGGGGGGVSRHRFTQYLANVLGLEHVLVKDPTPTPLQA